MSFSEKNTIEHFYFCIWSCMTPNFTRNLPRTKQVSIRRKIYAEYLGITYIVFKMMAIKCCENYILQQYRYDNKKSMEI